MAQQKKTGSSKSSSGRQKQYYSLEEAAGVTGLKEVDVLRSFYRGVDPGRNTSKDAKGAIRFDGASVRAYVKASKADTVEDAPGGSQTVGHELGGSEQ